MHEASFDCCVQADVNVSLTSISLLWNASDLLGKLYTKARSSSRNSLELDPVPNGNSGSPGAQLDSEQYQELVRLLYGALQVGHLLHLHISLSSKDDNHGKNTCEINNRIVPKTGMSSRIERGGWGGLEVTTMSDEQSAISCLS